jgi:hypothetical protein
VFSVPGTAAHFPAGKWPRRILPRLVSGVCFKPGFGLSLPAKASHREQPGRQLNPSGAKCLCKNVQKTLEKTDQGPNKLRVSI